MKKEHLEKLKKLASGSTDGPWSEVIKEYKSPVYYHKSMVAEQAVPELIDMVEKLTVAIEICGAIYIMVSKDNMAFAQVRRALEEVYE